MTALQQGVVGRGIDPAGELDPAGPAAPGVPLTSPRLVGREQELESLVTALSRAPSMVLIEGEAGIGKTRLVQELRARPEYADRRFLLAGCPAIQDPFPLGPVLDIVRRVRGELAGVPLSPVTGVLRPLLPELADLLPPPPEPLAGGAADRHLIFRGLRDLLAELGPVTVVIEDVHWADRQTIDLIHYLLSDPPDSLSIVVTFRGEEADPQVRELTSQRLAGLSRAHVVLARLDPGQTGQLAAAIMAAPQVPPDFAGYLCERTGGVPFAIEEVVAR